MTVSTTSEMGVVKSGLQNSGWKKISGPRKRSYPTSTEKPYIYVYEQCVQLRAYDIDDHLPVTHAHTKTQTFFVIELILSYTLNHLSGCVSYLLNSFATSGQMYPNRSLMALAVSSDCSGGIPDSLSLNSCWMK